MRQLLLGFLVAIGVTVLLALLARAAGWITIEDLLADRPQTTFIWTPDRWSFVVALLAGAAGVLSLTSGRSNVLVGVFISVTTVPPRATSPSGWRSGRARRSGSLPARLNLAGLVVAGVLTLLVQRVVWKGVRRYRGRTGRAGRTAGAGVTGPAGP